jgi:hypothetical protein
MRFTFDVLDGPAVEFTRTIDLPNVHAAQAEALKIIATLSCPGFDTEGWRVVISSADFVYEMPFRQAVEAPNVASFR